MYYDCNSKSFGNTSTKQDKTTVSILFASVFAPLLKVIVCKEFYKISMHVIDSRNSICSCSRESPLDSYALSSLFTEYERKA